MATDARGRPVPSSQPPPLAATSSPHSEYPARQPRRRQLVVHGRSRSPVRRNHSHGPQRLRRRDPKSGSKSDGAGTNRRGTRYRRGGAFDRGLTPTGGPRFGSPPHCSFNPVPVPRPLNSERRHSADRGGRSRRARYSASVGPRSARGGAAPGEPLGLGVAVAALDRGLGPCRCLLNRPAGCRSRGRCPAVGSLCYHEAYFEATGDPRRFRCDVLRRSFLPSASP
jgi:hypothetical protein